MSARNKSERFRRLISHGFFAPELPPCFVSEDLAKFRKSIWQAIEAIPPRRRRDPPAYQMFRSEPCSFYFPRFGRDDRKHGVINPVSYLAISKAVSENFVELRKVAKRSGLTASPLVFDWTGQRALVRSSVDMRDDFRVDLSSRREHFVVADIRAFFHSIYTHAIPWAIYGKAWSKRNRSNSHYGNLLDLLCRNAQDGQTIGLPVGPDTSRLIAEVVASAIDVQLRERLNVTGRDASRYVDDYSIGAKDGFTGDSLIANLRQSVAAFELELNSDKSAVYSTSLRLNTGWKQAVLDHIPRRDLGMPAFHRFFYEVGRVCDEQSDINVEKYAFQNARSAFVRSDNWKGVQSHLINAYRRNTSLVSFLVEVLILRNIETGDIDKNNVQGFLERRLPTLAIENRTGEITWLLFLAIRLGIRLSATRIAPLFEVENALVALLTNYAASHGLIIGNVDYRIWSRSLSTDGLEGPMWLYAYESVRQGINPSGNDSFITNHDFFAPIYSKNVSFLSIENGFTSMAGTLRSRRGENSRIGLLRADFIDDFEFEREEFDDDDEDIFDDEVDIY